MKKQGCVAVVCLGLAAGLCQAQGVNFTGMWKLNVEKSRWGKKQKPNSITIEIDHREPAFKYHGTVVDAQGDGRDFAFEGILDGKAYLYQSAHREGTIRVQRVDSRTVSSVFRSADGRVEETATARLSRGGKVLTYQIRLKDPSGEMSWTEVYEKK